MSGSGIALGKKGEDEAVRFLEALGYRLLERNYRCRFGEVDLIAKDGHEIVFVEVKTRCTDLYGSPKQSVDGRKQRRVCLASQDYLVRTGLTECLARFDVLSIVAGKDGFAVEHVKNAFETSD